MSLIFSVSAFVAKPARELKSCIPPPRAWRHWIGSRGEIQPALVAVLSDINMPGMDGLELLGEINSVVPICRS